MANSSRDLTDYNNLKINEVIIKPLKSTTRISFVWSFFGKIHLKESDKVIENFQQRMFCTECFKNVLEQAETIDLLFDM